MISHLNLSIELNILVHTIKREMRNEGRYLEICINNITVCIYNISGLYHNIKITLNMMNIVVQYDTKLSESFYRAQDIISCYQTRDVI